MLGAAAGGAVRTMRPVGVNVNAVLVICRQDFDLPGKDLPGAAEVLGEHFIGLLRRGVLSRAVAAVILNPARHGHDRDLLSVEIDVVARNHVAGLATALNTIRDGFRLLPIALPDRFTAAEVEHLASRVVGADNLQTSTRKID
ncbi:MULTISPECIES: hypothetical protein [unclassified Pseudonocardia]|uniref:hypothetical protein n=1 Tax=unclassified Pseudonocardia TaxID=2619320 RepID=UPI001CF70CFD|nr:MULTISPECIES: hypothetical protein [unclassified Pseudonocardia]